MCVVSGCNGAAKQPAHGRTASVAKNDDVFLRTYFKWMDGEQNNLDMARLESTPIAPALLQGKEKGT